MQGIVEAALYPAARRRPLFFDQKTRRVTDAIIEQYVAVAFGTQDRAGYRVVMKFAAMFVMLKGNL